MAKLEKNIDSNSLSVFLSSRCNSSAHCLLGNFSSSRADFRPDHRGLVHPGSRQRRGAQARTRHRSGSRRSYGPVLSGDGRWVAFESAATNLVVGDNNGIPDLFIRDTLIGTTIRASHNALSSGGNSRSEAPSISADGQRVAFASDANFGAAKPNSKGEVYVRDLPSGTTIWASTNVYYPNSSSGPAIRSFNPVLSADGRFVAFKAAFTSTNLYQHDLQTPLTTLIKSNVWWEGPPAMTPDGRYVAFESATNVFLWDSQTGSNTLVSVDWTGDGPAHGTSLRPALPLDARRIAFLSNATKPHHERRERPVSTLCSRPARRNHTPGERNSRGQTWQRFGR